MFRLTHTFMILAICLASASSASARQREMDAAFPSALSKAIDNTAVENGKFAPQRRGTPTTRPRSNTRDYRVESDRGRSNSSKTIPSKNASYPSARKSTNHVNKWPANQRTRELAPATTRSNVIAMPPKPLTPFPRAKAPIASGPAPFTRELTPFPRHRLPKPMSTNDVRPLQSENFANGFGTVMTFPAADRTINAAIKNQTQNSSSQFAKIGNSVQQPVHPPANGLEQIGSLPQQVIHTTVIGPQTLVQDVPDLFEIEVTNASDRTASNIVVQMGVSEDLTITDFDRKAWLDGGKRTVSWKIDGLQSGFKDVIRFRAVSATPGRHEQSITVGMQNTFQGQTGFVANVIQNPTSQISQRPDSEK